MYHTQDLRIPVVPLAVLLAVVSALLALALLWQTHRQRRLRRAGRLGASDWTAFSVVLSLGNILFLVGDLWIVALSMLSRINPYLVTDPQICPPQPPQGPRYPCDPTMNVIQAANAVQLMWCLLVVGSICYALSVVVLIAGSRAGRRIAQRGAPQSKLRTPGKNSGRLEG